MAPDEAHKRKFGSGILLVNLGTPDQPSAAGIRRYLKQFLSDRRVVELPRLLWLIVLHLFILPFRPRKLVGAYEKVWTKEGSPLMAISKRQQNELAARFDGKASVHLAMTYGSPSIPDTLQEMADQGVRRVAVLPLYPQYSGTTTAAVFDSLFESLKKQRWMQEVRTIGSYHDHPAYISALAQSIRLHWESHGRGDHLLMSFHSIPRQCLEAGDPYYCQCHVSARMLAEALELKPSEFTISFQSRLGNQPWLQPYSDIVIPELAIQGNRTLDVICPGFSADCLETLEEVAIRYAKDFADAGGKTLRYIPALNDRHAHIDALQQVCEDHLQGWLQGDSADAEERAMKRIQRVAEIEPSLYRTGIS